MTHLQRSFLITLLSLIWTDGTLAQTAVKGLSQPGPSPAQIQSFCSKYANADNKYKTAYIKQFQQYCQTSKPLVGTQNSPITEQKLKQKPAKIRQLRLPKCLAKDKQVEVIGAGFNLDNIRCTMGPGLKLQPISRNSHQILLRITTTPRQNTRYRLRCRAGQQTKTSRRINTCKKIQAVVKTAPPEVLKRPDLAGTLHLLSSVQTAAGSTQSIKIDYRNLGPGATTQRFAIDLVLVIDDLRQSSKPANTVFGNKPVVRQTLKQLSVPQPGTTQTLFTSVTIPSTIKPGRYYWCLRLDPDFRLKEISEQNNTQCLAQTLGTTSVPARKLTGVFGARLRDRKPTEKLLIAQQKLPVPASKIHLRELIKGLPGNLRTLDGEVPLLSLNDEIMGPVDIAQDGPAELSWIVPAMSGDQVYLVISATDHYSCPSGPVEANRSELDALALPGTISGVKPAEGNSSLHLDAYTRGRPYYIWGCVVRAAAFTGVKTNRLEMHYAYLVAATTINTPVTGVFSPPDLVIRQFRRLGANRLFFWVQATSRAPAGRYPWKIYVINPLRFNQLHSSEDFYRLTPGVGVLIYSGEGEIKNLGFFGYGDAITTDVAIPDGQPWVVILEVNLPAHPTGDRLIIGPGDEPGPATPEHYPEANYGNNTASLILGDQYTSFPNSILTLQTVRYGDGWAIFKLRYIQHAHLTSNISLELLTLTDPVSNTIHCVGRPGDVEEVNGYAGDNNILFYCRRLEGQLNDGSMAVVRMMNPWMPTRTLLASKIFPTGFRWREENRGTGLPDLASQINSPETGPAGYGGNLVLEIQNRGDALVENVAATFTLKNHGPYGKIRDQRSLRYTRINPGQTITRLISLSPRLAFVDHSIARWSVDPEDEIMESDERNNTTLRAMPAGLRSGQINISLGRFATSQQTTFHRQGLCIFAVGGHAWPSAMALPAGTGVLVGYHTEYDGGVCENLWAFDAYGYVDFDLEPYHALAARLHSATLVFQRTGSPAHREAASCHNNGISQVTAATSDWRGRGSAFSINDTPTTGLSAGTPREDGGSITTDVTTIVRRWLRGDDRQFGFLLKGASKSSHRRLTMNCGAYYGNFALYLRVGE